jgi:sugar phosphate isomerase/epimerase
MKISIITDEISSDPETAIELGVAWGVRDFELRGFFTDRAPRFSDYQKQRLRDLLSEHQARIVAIGPGLFKMAFPARQAPHATLGWMDRNGYESWSEARRAVKYHLNELLPESLAYAHELGAPLVVIFGFDRAGAPPGKPPEEVLNCLRLAAERAEAAGLQLALENEAGFWADTGARTAHIVHTINHPALGINWDPANAFFAGDLPFPVGYSAVQRLVCHVHFKDADRDKDGEPHYSLEGQINWADQIKALSADGFEGFISIETHLRPKVAAGRAALERLRTLINAAQDRPPATL